MSKRDLYIKAKSSAGWVRPSDWLSMPNVSPTDDTFVGLHAIFPSGNNFAAFRFTTSSGDYQVDWGDGTVTTHASNTTAEHTYDYDTYDPTNTTLSTRGYKQAIIVVTPLTGDLTTCNFQFRRTTTPAQNQVYSTGFLDCIVSMPNATTGASIVFGGTTVRHGYVERFEFVSIGSCTSMVDMFLNCNSLQSVPLFDTSSVTNMGGMFNGCFSIQSVPLFNTSSVTNMNSMFNNCLSIQSVPLFNTSSVTFMSGMFNSCFSLQSVPLFNTSSVTNMNSMFRDCRSIQSVPLFDTSSVTNIGFMFNNCFSIQYIPAFNTSSITNIINTFNNCFSLDRTDIVCRVSVEFLNCQLSQAELVNIFNNLLDITSLSSQNINISGNWGATALTTTERDIALDKNWTITG
jgi:surface protein